VFRKTLSFCCRRAASKVMSSTLLCWPITIRGRCWWYGSRGWTFPPIFQCILLLYDRLEQRGQFDRMASDMDMCMKQRSATEFLRAEKITPVDIHRHLLNIYGDQTVHVSTVWWQVVHFSTADSRLSLLVQIFASTACRFLFTDGKIA